MPDLQLYWQAEALYKKLPKKFDLSSWAVLGELDNEGRTPLALAVQAGHHRVASVLLERKAMIDPVDKEGNTVLMLAASSPSRNALMIVELLLSLNADVQASNFEKLRAVDVAKAPKVRQLLRMQMDRLEVGQKLKSSQSLPALKD
ncbi:Ankyrin repeat domain-containing protein 50 [Durusdinium trenchii]|uniref:Ankyrin repeat domain-containing protein 50 n=1 Tax=Durusdinium trenchii TaxID=1381693 RepID=A0ABP0PEQ1_9DINO